MFELLITIIILLIVCASVGMMVWGSVCFLCSIENEDKAERKFGKILIIIGFTLLILISLF